LFLSARPVSSGPVRSLTRYSAEGKPAAKFTPLSSAALARPRPPPRRGYSISFGDRLLIARRRGAAWAGNLTVSANKAIAVTRYVGLSVAFA